MKKKLVTLLFATTLSLSLMACGNSSEPETEQAQEETTEDSSTDDSDDELSQSEWMEQNGGSDMSGGYEIVDTIDIYTDEYSLTYTGNEIMTIDNVDEVYQVIVVYFDFANNTEVSDMAENIVHVELFQNGMQLEQRSFDGWDNIDESIQNTTKSTLFGTKINVGFTFDIEDTTSPITMRVTNSDYSEIFTTASEVPAQQQEITLQ